MNKLFRHFRSNIITGFLLLIPLAATVFVIRWLLTTVDNLISQNWFPGVGVLVVLMAAFLTGLLAKNYFGRMLIETGNAFIGNIPLLNKIYLGVQQILDAVVSTNRRLFDRAVLVEYPKKDCYCIGFVTADTRGEVPRLIQEDVLSVFIPTTPNPTSGFLLFLKRADVIELEMSVETAIKTVMSAGMVDPDSLRKTSHVYTIPDPKKWNWLKIFSRDRRKDLTIDPRD
ncbi:MAG: DUF502 domain-containing protein [Fibrobacterota bacterium]